jgi:hypothetical protein
MKNKKYHTVGTIPKSNLKIVESTIIIKTKVLPPHAKTTFANVNYHV